MKNALLDALYLHPRGIISIVGAGGKTSLMFRLAKELAASGKKILTTTTTKIFMPSKDQSPDTILAYSIDDLVALSDSFLARHTHFSAGRTHDNASGKLSGFAPDVIDTLWRASLFDWIIVEADGAKQTPLKATNLHEPVLPELTTHLILVTGLDAVGTPLDDQHVHRAQLFSQNTGLPLGEILDEQSIATSIALEMKKANRLCHPFFNIVFLNKADTPGRIAIARKIGTLLLQQKNIDTIVTASLDQEAPVKNCLTLEKTKPKDC